MREIKFQVFAKDWEGVEKCFDVYFLHLLDDGRYRIAFTNSDSDKEFVTVDSDKIRFFTGLHDKNGTPIYEGDIVKGYWWDKGKQHRHIGRVAYVMNSFNVRGVKQYLGYDDGLNPSYEVIGNVFEHSHLLEQTT